MKKEGKIITFTKYILTVLSYYLFYKFLWSYLISLLLIYYLPKFHGKAISFQEIIRSFINFEYQVELLIYHFTCLCLSSISSVKNSNEFRIFTVTILYHLFILKRCQTFSIGNRNKSDDKKVTDYRDDHNLAYVFEHVHIQENTHAEVQFIGLTL